MVTIEERKLIGFREISIKEKRKDFTCKFKQTLTVQDKYTRKLPRFRNPRNQLLGYLNLSWKHSRCPWRTRCWYWAPARLLGLVLLAQLPPLWAWTPFWRECQDASDLQPVLSLPPYRVISFSKASRGPLIFHAHSWKFSFIRVKVIAPEAASHEPNTWQRTIPYKHTLTVQYTLPSRDKNNKPRDKPTWGNSSP